MHQSATRCLAMVACAATVASVVTAIEAEASGRHVRMHRHHHVGFNGPPAGAIAPVVVPVNRGSVCPGNARAIDCKIWPPPFDDDPDRKATSSDGAG